jgi:hypothetical protein
MMSAYAPEIRGPGKRFLFFFRGPNEIFGSFRERSREKQKVVVTGVSEGTKSRLPNRNECPCHYVIC